MDEPESESITFEDIVRTPPEKQEQVDAFIKRCIELSCEEQNTKYPLS